MNHKKFKQKSQYFESLAKIVPNVHIKNLPSYLTRNCFAENKKQLVAEHFKKWSVYEQKCKDLLKEMNL